MNWNEVELQSEWLKVSGSRILFRFGSHNMTYGEIRDSRITECRGKNVSNPWMTTDGQYHEKLAQAKCHEMETEVKPNLIKDGYLDA